jgi:hypothetical protein
MAINPAGTLPPELFAEQQQLNRQQQMAQMLMQQGTQQPQGQMVSGRYVAPSFFQYAAPLAQLYAGKSLAEKGDKQALELAAKLRGQQQKMGEDYFNAISPQQIELAGPTPTGAPLATVNQPDFRKAFSIATDPYAPSFIKSQAAEMLKPQKVGEGEKVIRFNPATGKNEVVAEGGEKYRAPIQIDTGTAIEIRDPRNPTVVLQTIPKLQMPTAGQVVETANGPMIVNTRTGDATPIMAGGQPLSPKLSSEQSKDITAINQQKAVIDSALQLVKSAPTAFSFARGAAGALPFGETLAGRTETPAETEARSAVFNIVSKVINERAGAAQSAQELKRLNAFLPSELDNAKKIEDKLKGFNKFLEEQEKGTRAPTSKPFTPSTLSAPTAFTTEADAQNAFNSGKLKVGDKITINGVTGTWR